MEERVEKIFGNLSLNYIYTTKNLSNELNYIKLCVFRKQTNIKVEESFLILNLTSIHDHRFK